MGKINAGFFEYCPLGEHSTATTSALGALPLIGLETAAPILLSQSLTNGVLKLKKVCFYGIDLHRAVSFLATRSIIRIPLALRAKNFVVIEATDRGGAYRGAH